jgi:hypothetical protein
LAIDRVQTIRFATSRQRITKFKVLSPGALAPSKPEENAAKNGVNSWRKSELALF